MVESLTDVALELLTVSRDNAFLTHACDRARRQTAIRLRK